MSMMQPMRTSEEQSSIRRHDYRKRKRSREERHVAPSIAKTAVVFLLAGVLPCGVAHRQRVSRQGSSSLTPSSAPIIYPSLIPSHLPSSSSDLTRQNNSYLPSLSPTYVPSNHPSSHPSASISTSPSSHPSSLPSILPSEIPSILPSLVPSLLPSLLPSDSPSLTAIPSIHPSLGPSGMPSLGPSSYPSIIPTGAPSDTITFRTVPCSFDPEVEGYELAESLLADIIEYEVEKPFILCPNVTFEEMEIFLQSRSVPLSIECGGEDCLWTAAEGHLVVTGPTAAVAIKGITFVGAVKTSIQVVGTDTQVHFEECVWSENSGKETVWIDAPRQPDNDDTPEENSTIGSQVDSDTDDANTGNTTIGNSTSGSQVESEARLLQEESISVSFIACSFINNEARAAIVASHNGELLVEACSFENNLVEKGSVLLVDGGAVELQKLRLERNYFDTSRGIVFVGGDATVTNSESMCTSSNTGMNAEADGCEGILIKELGDCVNVDPCETLPPTAAPSVIPSAAPSFVSRDCYSSLQGLQAAIDDASLRDEPATIRVCANWTLDGNSEWMFSPIEITTGDIRLECGESGQLSEGCIIFGGDIQFHLGPNVKSVEFSGFSMVDAGKVSVVAAGNTKSEASFQHCQWRYNRAVAAVLVYNEASGEPYVGQWNIEQIQRPSKASMSVDFDSCFFEENHFSYSALAIVRGRTSVKSTMFQNNGTSRLGAIGATEGSEVELSYSCFIENEALLDGIIMIDATSNITLNILNFGTDNDSLLGSCTAVFNDVNGTCAMNGDCQGDCLPFVAESCDNATLDADRFIGETPPPVQAPTKEPELPPPPVPSTNQNSTRGDNDGELSPSGGGPGAAVIVLIIIVVMIVLCVAWRYWRKRNKKATKPDKAAKPDKKVKKAPSFKGKKAPSFKKKASQKKYDDDDDDDYDDYDESYHDDDSDVTPEKKKETPKRGWFGRAGSSTKAGKDKKKKEHKEKEKDKEEEEKKKGKDKKGKKEKKKKVRRKRDNDDDSAVDSGSSDGFEDEPVDEESGKSTPKKSFTFKMGSGSGRKLKKDKSNKSNLSLSSLASEATGSLQQKSTVESLKDFDPF